MTSQSRQRRQPGPGQESVWDYPRPPRVEQSPRRVMIRAGEVVVADTIRAVRVLETSHPPGWYLPPDDIDLTLLRRSSAGSTVCEWKGAAVYWDVIAGVVLPAVAWSYPRPKAGFEVITDHLAFYPSLLTCTVDDEPVEPQAGGFYGGWITRDVVGPFKGESGTWGW